MKIHTLFLGLVAVVAVFGCRSTLHGQMAYPKKLGCNDSIVVRIEAIDLSEDLSRISTNNDEILVLMYGVKDSFELTTPIIVGYKEMDDNHRVHYFKGNTGAGWEEKSIVVFMVEVDTDKSPSQIEPIFRIHYKEIIKAFESGDFKRLQEYLGDDDLLGFRFVSNLSLGRTNFEFVGVHKLDEFNYKLEILFSN